MCTALCLLASCTQGKTMLTFRDKKLSVNVYEFLLSRMKGTLGYYGYDVTSDSFWRTVVSSDGTTYDDYFREEILRETKHYIIADQLFDDYGLTLSAEQEKKIDDLLLSHQTKAGSRAALNEKLLAFGVNYDILREIYVMESKISTLKNHLYGENAEKVLPETKDKFLNDNYVCFEQIFIPAYYYVTDLDRFNDKVYYTDEKHTAIAYDKVNGKIATDETGKIATDIFGDPEYYTDEGRIAYDRQNGVIGYVYEKDANGKYTDDKVIAYHDEKTKAQLYVTAQEYATVCNGDFEKFEQYSSEYGQDDTSGRIYLFASAGYYASLNSSAGYFDDIAKELADMDVGECRVVTSDYGYHVLQKNDNAKGAYDDAELKETYFSDFSDNLIEYLWGSLCQKYIGDVAVDEKALSEAPDMKQVGANLVY